jgi:hypothetical protein
VPALLLIGALLLGGRIYWRHRRDQMRLRPDGREPTERWEDEGGALPVTEPSRT